MARFFKQSQCSSNIDYCLARNLMLNFVSLFELELSDFISDFIDHLSLDTPSIEEFIQMGKSIKIWTDFMRYNDTYFRSGSTGSIIGGSRRRQPSMFEEMNCLDLDYYQTASRYASISWPFESYPVVLSDLMGNLRLGY